MAQHQRDVTVSKDCKVKCQGDMVVDKNLSHKNIYQGLDHPCLYKLIDEQLKEL